MKTQSQIQEAAEAYAEQMAPNPRKDDAACKLWIATYDSFIAGANFALSQSVKLDDKALEDITDEEKIEVGKILWSQWDAENEQLMKQVLKVVRDFLIDDECELHSFKTTLSICQYLQSKGYKLPVYFPPSKLAEKPLGYLFEGKFYKEIPERTFFEGNEPIAVYSIRESTKGTETGQKVEQESKPNRLETVFYDLLCDSYIHRVEFTSDEIDEAFDYWYKKAGLTPPPTL